LPARPTLCIRGAGVLPDAAGPVIRRDIWLAGARILALADPEDTPPPPDVPVLDAAGCLALPGLVDAHSHGYTALLPDTVPGAPLDLFVLEAMARRAPRSARTVYVSTLLHGLQLLRRGVTGLVDHVRHGPLPTLEALDATFEAYRDLGLRATVAPMYEDRPYVDSLPFERGALPAPVRARWAGMTRPPPQAYFDLMDAAARWRGHAGRLDLMLGVDGPQRCTPELLALTGRYAERHAMGLHTHLLEARTQLMMAPPGRGLVSLLDDHGLVNPRSSLVHFVWCTGRDMRLVADRGATVVHNPLSNLHLGSGLQPTRRLLDMGIPVALGTDSESGHGASLLEQARLMAVLSRVQGLPERQWIDSREALHAATAAGARVLGLPAGSGTIAPGAIADVTLVDTTGLDWVASRDAATHLVMYEQGANVRHAVVHGDVVLRERRATGVDEAALLAEARALADADDRANAPFLEIAARERDAFGALLEAAMARPLRTQRFARLR
jgi:5-methylthioadenosine/S-adenosylhomocysteine deaminase